MRTLSVLRSQAFRIVFVYVAVFALSVSALLAFTYWNTERALDAQTDQIIDAEITGLAEQYQRLGLRGLAEVVMSRSAHGGPGLYLLLDRAKQPIADRMQRWIEQQRDLSGRLPRRYASIEDALRRGGTNTRQ